MALSLAEAGYAVVVHHRDDDADAALLVDEIHALGGQAATVRADLSNETETAGLIRAAAQAVGPLSLLVNNASTFRHDKADDLDRATWDAHFEPNLRAPLVLAQHFAAQTFEGMQEAGDPSIVNLLDQRVWKPNPQFFSYTLTKSALWTATRTLAQALAPRIRVNAIGPGPTLPNTIEGEAGLQAEAANIPLQRRTDVADICGALRYLIDARAVTGQMIAVDGGQHLAWRTPDIIEF